MLYFMHACKSAVTENYETLICAFKVRSFRVLLVSFFAASDIKLDARFNLIFKNKFI